jgi:hypothetical protein
MTHNTFSTWNAPAGYRHDYHYIPVGAKKTAAGFAFGVPENASDVVLPEEGGGEYERIVAEEETGETGTMMLVREGGRAYIVAIDPLFEGPYRQLRPEEKTLQLVKAINAGEPNNYPSQNNYKWTSPVSGVTYFGTRPNYEFSHGLDARLAYRRTCALCPATIPDDARPEMFKRPGDGMPHAYPVVCEDCRAHALIPAEEFEVRRVRALKRLYAVGADHSTAKEIIRSWGPTAVRDFTGVLTDADVAKAFRGNWVAEHTRFKFEDRLHLPATVYRKDGEEERVFLGHLGDGKKRKFRVFSLPEVPPPTDVSGGYAAFFPTEDFLEEFCVRHNVIATGIFLGYHAPNEDEPGSHLLRMNEEWARVAYGEGATSLPEVIGEIPPLDQWEYRPKSGAYYEMSSCKMGVVGAYTYGKIAEGGMVFLGDGIGGNCETRYRGWLRVPSDRKVTVSHGLTIRDAGDETREENEIVVYTDGRISIPKPRVVSGISEDWHKERPS